MVQLLIYKITTELVVQCLNTAPEPCYPTLIIERQVGEVLMTLNEVEGPQ